MALTSNQKQALVHVAARGIENLKTLFAIAAMCNDIDTVEHIIQTYFGMFDAKDQALLRKEFPQFCPRVLH